MLVESGIVNFVADQTIHWSLGKLRPASGKSFSQMAQGMFSNVRGHFPILSQSRICDLFNDRIRAITNELDRVVYVQTNGRDRQKSELVQNV